MSKLSISLAEKRILSHISLGGSASDAIGKDLLVKFATAVLKNEEIAHIAQRYKISHQDICVMYASMISRLMPNPCINCGGLLLVPTLFFMEPFRFLGLASEIAARGADQPDDVRLELLITLSGDAAQQTWNAHTASYGEAKFAIHNAGGARSSGCSGIIVAGFIIFAAIGIGVNWLLG